LPLLEVKELLFSLTALACRRRLASSPSIPPVTLSRGPILENVYQGDDIDVYDINDIL
jgi:hypothetical protein